MGAWPGAKVFQVAPVVEVSATAGDDEVTGSARITFGGTGEAAAAREVCSLGRDSALAATGSARRTVGCEVEATSDGNAFSFWPVLANPAFLRPARRAGGGDCCTESS